MFIQQRVTHNIDSTYLNRTKPRKNAVSAWSMEHEWNYRVTRLMQLHLDIVPTFTFTLWVCTQRVASCLHFDRFYVIRTRYTFRDIDERVEHGGTWLELLANTLERGDNHVVIWKQQNWLRHDTWITIWLLTNLLRWTCDFSKLRKESINWYFGIV